MLLVEDDSALKVAQQIKFHGPVGYKPVAYKEIKVVVWMKKIQSHVEEILKKLNIISKKQSHMKIMTAS